MISSPKRAVAGYLHTHWDREWYRSFEDYRVRLSRTLLAILDYLEADSERVFLLDGQTVVLEDFLALYPDSQPRFEKLIQAQRLQIGPWYVLPDEFLVSGEALIRNLQLGTQQARRFGQTRFMGYLPDMFGHLAQMPQLLAQSQLSPALIWRGVQPESAWFYWEGLDGTPLPTVHLTKGYYQDALHQEPPDWAIFESFLQAIEAVTPPDLPLLLPIGADHMGLPAQLDARLAAARSRFPDYDLQLVSLSDYLKQLTEAAPPTLRLRGELRQPEGAYVLPGVWSTRRYLKQANDAVQTLLERELEPLLVYQKLSGTPPEQALLWQAWKYLLQNQPHDSICGCSIDEVHQDMLPRFRWATEIARALQQRAWQSWGGQQPGAAPGLSLNLLNNSPAPYTGTLTCQIDFAADEAVSHFVIQDAQGVEVPCEVLRQEDLEVFVAEPEILPHWEEVRRFHCLLQVKELPALSCSSYRICPEQRPASSLPAPAALGPEPLLENDHVRVTLDRHSGQLRFACKDPETQTWLGLVEGHFFVSEGDAGDEYNYDPPHEDSQVSLSCSSAEVEPLALGTRLHLRYQGQVPARLQQDRRQRSQLSVPLRITSTLTLYPNESRVHIQTEVHNQARDQRLRLLLQSPEPLLSCEAGTAFGVLTQQPAPDHPIDMPKGQERPADTFPYSDWIHLRLPDQGWLLYTEGLHEAALLNWEGKPSLALTLLRSVGWLSRDNLRSRGGGAGPRMPTPEAQCLGSHRYDYVLDFCGPERRQALQALNSLRHPLQVFQGQEPALKQLFSGLPPEIHVSGLTLSQDQEAVILRLVNESPEPLYFTLQPGFAWQQISVSDPLEQSEQLLSQAPDCPHISLAPQTIMTLKCTPAASHA